MSSPDIPAVAVRLPPPRHAGLSVRLATLEKELLEQQSMLKTIAAVVGGLPNRSQILMKTSLGSHLGVSNKQQQQQGSPASDLMVDVPAGPATRAAGRGPAMTVFLPKGPLHSSVESPPSIAKQKKTADDEKSFIEKTRDKVENLVRDIGRFVGGEDFVDDGIEDERKSSGGQEEDADTADAVVASKTNPLVPGSQRVVHFSPEEEDNTMSNSRLSKSDISSTGKKRMSRARSKQSAGGVEIATYHAEHPGVVCIDTVYAVLVTIATIITINALADENMQSMPPLYIPVSLGLFQVFFAFWMYSRLFVRYRDNEWNVVDTAPLIRKNYMRNRFMFDLLLTVPAEFLFIGWLNVVFRALCARHFLRWVRLYSLGKCSNPLLPARSWFHFFMVFCLIVASTHAFTVLFRRINVGDEIVFNPVTNTTSMARMQEDYLTSLFNIIATVTSVGYGDFAIRSDSVRVLLIAVMIFGVSCIATFSAFATKFLTHQDLLVAEMNEKKRKMHSMLRYYGIPWELQREVISMFPSVLEMDNELNLKKCLSGLPQVVMAKIDKYLRVKLLRQTPVFRSVSSLDALRAVAEVLQVVNVEGGVEIISADSVGEEMYIIIQGVVEVSKATNGEASRRNTAPSIGNAAQRSVEREVLAFLYPGQFFGEIALLRNTVRMATVTSVTSCQLLSLSKSNFDSIMKSYPDVFQMIVEEMEKRLAKVGESAEAAVELAQEEAAPALASRPGRGLSFTVSASLAKSRMAGK
jgi:CRP-like cAMP-binding protein